MASHLEMEEVPIASHSFCLKKITMKILKEFNQYTKFLNNKSRNHTNQNFREHRKK